ncbi:uncharacterized protein BT62DRAFT_553747 [Guyanagaster necrorhizus]|uniref:Uncharacterized protein n=1 Tax=Guyanagaster necrorhizus TaxID=856835 RepID=A0A9P7VHL0_9AGAR|nr:uncharacterized protein BT62DRAFT_553747 [Guyanagaster necrorhizus MCA 3950]KAG7441196.1 hypothetical protein BT62DRAFT_553747 [Guyanagaster necrorhizus MCA 3950]
MSWRIIPALQRHRSLEGGTMDISVLLLMGMKLFMDAGSEQGQDYKAILSSPPFPFLPQRQTIPTIVENDLNKPYSFQWKTPLLDRGPNTKRSDDDIFSRSARHNLNGVEPTLIRYLP